MSAVYLTTVGAVDAGLAQFVGREVWQAFALRVVHVPGLANAEGAWDRKRRQYNAPLILSHLLEHLPREAFRLLALTELDLYIPMLTFIFGQAQLAGVLAIVSLARLRQEFYGLPDDRELLFERARKEVVHELGHTFGLVHCRETACVMALATNVRQLDLKRSAFCAGCTALVADALGRANPDRMEGQG